MRYYTGNFYLTPDQMKVNAEFFWNLMQGYGWTLNAVSALLGNAEEESSVNPGIWQSLREGNMNGGYGLLQWTPASKYIDWCNENGYDRTQMEIVPLRLEYERQNNLQYYPTDKYPLSFSEFMQSNDSPYTLALAWVANYERPANPDQPERGDKAEKWHDYLSNITPPDPGGKLPVPVISPASGTYNNQVQVSIYATQGTARYAIGSGGFIAYQNPFIISESTSVRAYARAEGFTDSDIVENVYNIVDNPDVLNPPTFEPPAGVYKGRVYVTISYEGTTCYYKIDNGNWNVYTEPIRMIYPGVIYAYSVEEGKPDSAVSSAAYVVVSANVIYNWNGFYWLGNAMIDHKDFVMHANNIIYKGNYYIKSGPNYWLRV